MLYKLVVNKQIRMLDTKEPLTLEALNSFVHNHFPHLKRFSFYYIDEEEDHINLDTNQDVAVYLENSIKKPKIYVQQKEDQRNVFDSNSHVIQPIAEIKVQEPSKQQKESEEEKDQPKTEEKPEQPQIIELKEEVPEEKPKEEKSIIAHNAKCNQCEVEPIKGIRYKCSQCEDYDLCGKCIINQKHDQEHPFIKIRDQESAPLNVQIGLQEKQKKEEEVEEKKEKPMPNNSVLKFENRSQKQIIIATYLESELGSDNFNSYVQFARQTNQNQKQQILENYLYWIQRKNDPSFHKVLHWLKDRVESTANSVGQLFQMFPNNRQINQNRPRNNQQ